MLAFKLMVCTRMTRVEWRCVHELCKGVFVYATPSTLDP